MCIRGWIIALVATWGMGSLPAQSTPEAGGAEPVSSQQAPKEKKKKKKAKELPEAEIAVEAAIPTLPAIDTPEVKLPTEVLLLQAVENKDAKAVRDLLKEEPNLDSLMHSNQPVYQWVRIGKEDVGESNPNQKLSVLHANAAHPDREILDLLLKEGARIDQTDSEGRSPLVYSLAQPDGGETTLHFVQNGANYTLRDKQKNSTLHYAAQGGDPSSIQLMVSGGVDINSQNESGTTPLHVAAIQSRRPTLNTFLELGADLKARDRQGQTVLHYAAGANREEVKFLYEQSPSLFRDAKDGTNPLDLAFAKNNTEVALFYRRKGHEFGAFRYEDLLKAVELKDHQAVQDFLNAGANPNRPAEIYPIHIAAKNGDVTSLRYLLRFDANIEQPDPDGRTPLAITLEEHHPEATLYLLQKGARPASKWLPSLTWNLRDDEYRKVWLPVIREMIPKIEDPNLPGGDLKMPALHYAAYFGLEELARDLIEHGADPKQKDQHGWEPLHWAVMKREIIASIPSKVAIAEYLFQKGVSANARTHQPKELPHRQPYLARRVPGNASPIDLLDYALPKDSVMQALLDTMGSQPSMLAADFYENGTELLKLKLYDAALVEFNKCLKREPQFAEAYYYRGMAKRKLSMPESAIIDFGQAIEYRPFYPEAWEEAGKTRLDLENYPEAEINLTKALSQGVRTPEIHYLIGISKLRQSKVDEACQDFSRAAGLGDPDAKAAIDVYCK